MVQPGRRKRFDANDETANGDRMEEIVDDLAVAAQYAMAVAPATPAAVAAEAVVVVEEEKDADEICLEDDSSDVETEQDEAKDDTDEDDEASAAESDVDLTELLARMVDEDDDEEEEEDGGGEAEGETRSKKSSSKPILSANEVDGYSAEYFAQTTSSEAAFKITSNWRIAGTIQHHMIDDRTVVVLSQAGGTLLQEESLLVLIADHRVIPLGKVFEVFGPISQPLYSIRLAKPADIEKRIDKRERGKLEDCNTETKSDEKVLTSEEQTTDERNRTRSRSESKCDDDSKTDSKTVPPDSEQSNPSATLPPPIQDDPWSKDGVYAKLLKTSKHMPVYFLEQAPAVTKVLDPAAIYRMNGRGCDASNKFDEEITNAKELDYSDDEQERAAKSGSSSRRNSRGSRGGADGSTSDVHNSSRGRGGRGRGYNHHHVPNIEHQQPYSHPIPAYNANYSYPTVAPTPQGFYQPAVGGHFYPQAPHNAPPYQQQPYFAVYSQPPQQQPLDQNTAQQEQSDTVYYDFS
jgi:rRNA processing protein Gar1